MGEHVRALASVAPRAAATRRIVALDRLAIGGFAGLMARGGGCAPKLPGLSRDRRAVAGSERPAAAPLPAPEPVVLSARGAGALRPLSRHLHRCSPPAVAPRRSERAAALEAQAFAATPGKAIEWLSMADGVLLSAYLQARPDCALPLGALLPAPGARAFRAAAIRVDPPRAARRHGLFEQMARAATAKAERRLTAAAYAGFAADLLTMPAPARAAEMLSRGLLLVPDDIDANIALSILLLRDRRPDGGGSAARPGSRRAPRQPRGPAAPRPDARRFLGRWPRRARARETRHCRRDRLDRARRRAGAGPPAARRWRLRQGDRLPRMASSSAFPPTRRCAWRSPSRRPAPAGARRRIWLSQAALAAKAAPGEGARRRFAELPIRLCCRRRRAPRRLARAPRRISPRRSPAIPRRSPVPAAPRCRGVGGAGRGPRR